MYIGHEYVIYLVELSGVIWIGVSLDVSSEVASNHRLDNIVNMLGADSYHASLCIMT